MIRHYKCQHHTARASNLRQDLITAKVSCGIPKQSDWSIMMRKWCNFIWTMNFATSIYRQRDLTLSVIYSQSRSRVSVWHCTALLIYCQVNRYSSFIFCSILTTNCIGLCGELEEWERRSHFPSKGRWNLHRIELFDPQQGEDNYHQWINYVNVSIFSHLLYKIRISMSTHVTLSFFYGNCTEIGLLYIHIAK